MHDFLTDRVFALVAKERGTKQEKLKLSTTLSRDLGMEGDDAVEFFEKFEREFAVDLRSLGEHWAIYFAPEGVPPALALLVVLPASIIAFLLIKIFPRFPEWICFLIGFLLWIILLVSWARFRGGKNNPQISVQDLIDCAHAGRWVKIPPDNASPRMNAHEAGGGRSRWFTW